MPKPAGVPNSVFDIAKPPPVAASPRQVSPLIDLGTLKIRSGVPLPERVHGGGERAKLYKAVLAKMKVGDSVELLDKQARGLNAVAKTLGVSVSLRRIDATHIGVWRVAKK